jgi:hypothetical protein
VAHWFRGLACLGVALCSAAAASAAPHIELVATAAWNGWTRPGRTTEIEIRLTADTPTHATFQVAAGLETTRGEVNLVPGRVQWLHLPVASVDEVTIEVATPLGPTERRRVRLARSESPLLGVALATDAPVELDGFHPASLAADHLPRNTSAYTSMDALIIDATTLRALDTRQWSALLAHAADCGRIALLNVSSDVIRLLQDAGGCGGGALMFATSLADARDMIRHSLAVPVAVVMPLAMVPGSTHGDEPGSAHENVIWNRVLLVLAAYFAVAAGAAMFVSSLTALLLLPSLATVAILALLHGMQPAPQLEVWSEIESGAQVARYAAQQRLLGAVRGVKRMPLLRDLASGRSCDARRSMKYTFDASVGLATAVDFDTRLFQQDTICYSGTFPIVRAIAVEAYSDGSVAVRNAGSSPWPQGMLLADRHVYDVPALAPGDNQLLRPAVVNPLRDDVARTALARARSTIAALWPLPLSGASGMPIDAVGWLLVSIPPT